MDGKPDLTFIDGYEHKSESWQSLVKFTKPKIYLALLKKAPLCQVAWYSMYYNLIVFYSFILLQLKCQMTELQSKIWHCYHPISAN